eukprot:jgi/Phyca11/61403/gw1.44.332.1
MLADTGAVASLVNKRVLKRLGRASEPLRPYHGSLDSVPGHTIRVTGIIDLPVILGTLEKTLPFLAFRGLMDLEEQTMTLKETGEVLPLGGTRVEETYVATVASLVRLGLGHQALARADVRGMVVADNFAVLVEGVPGTDGSLGVARTLCAVTEGSVL